MAGIYEIVGDDGSKSNGLYRSLDEIRHFVGTQQAGYYDVHQILPSDPNGTVNSEYVGELRRHNDGQVSYSPVQTASRLT